VKVRLIAGRYILAGTADTSIRSTRRSPAGGTAQLRVGPDHLLDDHRRQFVQERLDDAEQPSMPSGTAQDPAQHIPTPFV